MPKDETLILTERRKPNNSNKKSPTYNYFIPQRWRKSNQNNYKRKRNNQNSEYWVWHWRNKKHFTRCKKVGFFFRFILYILTKKYIRCFIIIYQGKKWYVVAKPLPDSAEERILWRMSFDEHEREILKGQMKNVVRQLKVFQF